MERDQRVNQTETDYSKRLHLGKRQTAFVGVFLVVVLLFVSTFCMGVVRGASMEPTYLDGQVVLVRRRTPLSPALSRNDVVLLQRDRGEVIIKRIFRLQGEEVKPGYPYLIGPARTRALTDYYEQETASSPEGRTIRYSVPPGYIAVLGDNPSISEDSRYFGPVPIASVLGTVVAAPGPPPIAPDLRSRMTGPAATQ